MLYEERALDGQRLFLLTVGGVIDLVTVTVEDTGNEDGLVSLTVVDGRAVGVDQFEQTDITGAQGEGWGGVEFSMIHFGT